MVSAVRAQSSIAVIEGPTGTSSSGDAFRRDSSDAGLNRVKPVGPGSDPVEHPARGDLEGGVVGVVEDVDRDAAAHQLPGRHRRHRGRRGSGTTATGAASRRPGAASRGTAAPRLAAGSTARSRLGAGLASDRHDLDLRDAAWAGAG